MSGETVLPDQVKIENALGAVLDDLTDDVDSPARTDSLLIDVFPNDDGTQLVFRTHDPFTYAHHYESLSAWALMAQVQPGLTTHPTSWPHQIESNLSIFLFYRRGAAPLPRLIQTAFCRTHDPGCRHPGLNGAG